jgi:hypothetical protein
VANAIARARAIDSFFMICFSILLIEGLYGLLKKNLRLQYITPGFSLKSSCRLIFHSVPGL